MVAYEVCQSWFKVQQHTKMDGIMSLNTANQVLLNTMELFLGCDCIKFMSEMHL